MSRSTQPQKEKKAKVLSFHKNTRDKRYRRELREQLASDTKTISTMENFAGYVIIGWDEDGSPCASWHGTQLSPVPGSLLPAYASSVLTRCLIEHDRQSS